MKVFELLVEGKVSPAWRKKFEARIILGDSYNVKVVGGDKDLSKDAWTDAHAKAKAAFAKLVEEHPDGLCFKTYKEAVDHMMSMPYPNWPLKIEKRASYDGRTRNEPITIDYKDATLDDIKVEELEGGWYQLSINSKSGPSLSSFLKVFHTLYKRPRADKKGKEVNYGWRGNTFRVKATKKQIEDAIKSSKTSDKETADEKARKETPEYKKEKNKSDYAYRKQKVARDKLEMFNRHHYSKIVNGLIDEIWSEDEHAGVSLSYFNIPYYSKEIGVNIIINRIDQTLEKSSVGLMVDPDSPGAAERLKALETKRNAARIARIEKQKADLKEKVAKLKAELKKLPNFVELKVEDRNKHAVENDMVVTFKMIESTDD